MSAANVKLDGRVATANGMRILLSPAEVKVLARLLRSDSGTVTLDVLADVLHGPDGVRPRSNVAQVVVCRLRQKLSALPGHRIESIRGVGYRLHLPSGVSA